MKLHHLITFICLWAFFASCEKKESPITLPPKSDGSVLQVDMGPTYDYQFFVNLETQKIVHISQCRQWDLAFQSGPNEIGVYLNGAKQMAALATGDTNFASVNTVDTVQGSKTWKVDQASGEVDSTAIGDWTQKKQVYLIRLDNTGQQIRKIQLLDEDIFQYRFMVGDVTSTQGAVITVPKNKNQNYTYFSFDFLTTVENVEPNKADWDIQFTLYNYTFYDQNPPLPYVVNGVLLNKSSTSAYHDSVTVYDGIDANFASSVPLSNRRDVIGYAWKIFDRDLNFYTVDKRYNYIIKNQRNHYFKLRFLDFYSSGGVKGSPKFEYKQLK